jgi:hypothetical protein
MEKEHIVPGRFTPDVLDSLLAEAFAIADAGRRIAFLSNTFLGVEYHESTLIGGELTPEVFVINLQGVDCLTFIEYIEAMRLSKSFSQFQTNLRKVRYESGVVSFLKRNHFFTDWSENNKNFVRNVTGEITARVTKRVRKILNVREDGTLFLPGIQPTEREIDYIPSEHIDDAMFHTMKTGDYVGIYSDLQGLDVSHVGIFIRDGEMFFLRHASSHKEYRKVIDQDLKDYILNKPGIIVLRPEEKKDKEFI